MTFARKTPGASGLPHIRPDYFLGFVCRCFAGAGEALGSGRSPETAYAACLVELQRHRPEEAMSAYLRCKRARRRLPLNLTAGGRLELDRLAVAARDGGRRTRAEREFGL